MGSPGSSFVQSFFHREGGVGLRSKSFHFCGFPCPVLSCTSCESQWRCHFFPTSTSLWLLSVILLTQSGLSNPKSVTRCFQAKYDLTYYSAQGEDCETLASWLRVLALTLTTPCREPLQVIRSILPACMWGWCQLKQTQTGQSVEHTPVMFFPRLMKASALKLYVPGFVNS